MSAALRAEAEAMTGPEALPREGGEVVFAEPWQGRAVALALEAVSGLGLPWEAFRQRLIAAVAEDPERPYFTSWLVALERLVVDHGGADEAELDAHRMAAAAYRTTEIVDDDLQVFPIAADEATLRALLTEVFERWWRSVRFGPLINGAVYELAAREAPRLSELDGYLTIDLGDGHVHLCIGEHRGSPGAPVDPELARRRRCAHAELQRLWVQGAPRSWMFRMFNGEGAQQLTVLLPNPFLDDDQQALPEPDWSRLELWDRLRQRFLGLSPDPVDRSGTGFVHP